MSNLTKVPLKTPSSDSVWLYVAYQGMMGGDQYLIEYTSQEIEDGFNEKEIEEYEDFDRREWFLSELFSYTDQQEGAVVTDDGVASIGKDPVQVMAWAVETFFDE